MLIIGKNPIYEVLKQNPKDLNKLLLLKTVKPEKKLKEIVEIAEQNKISTVFLNKDQFLKYFKSKNKSEGIAQGVIGFMKDFEYTGMRDILDKCKKMKSPLLLLLDNITDPQNLGAIVRSAVCLGADGIVIPRHNSAEINHTSMKASSGAANMIPIAKEINLSNTIRTLKQNGFFIIGADSNTNKLIYEEKFEGPIAIVMGSEGAGLRPIMKQNCDQLIRIPMMAKIDSLNVSVSTAIFLYEVFRQKNVKK
jgi:23S rRNA (guanosine2251-2'-O)-methyltransferase